MANTILAHFNLELTQSQEDALAIAFCIAREQDKRNSQHPYTKKFKTALTRLEYLYQRAFGAAPAQCNDDNYKYAGIIKNGLSLLSQAPFFSAEQTTLFIKTINDALSYAAIIAELNCQTFSQSYSYFSHHYDKLQPFVKDIGYFLKTNERRAGHVDSRN